MTAIDDTNIDVQTFENALIKYQGSMTDVIAALKIGQTSFYRYLDKWDLREFMEQQRDTLADYSQSIIRTAIAEPGVPFEQRYKAATWYLTNSKAGKRAGYGKSEEVNVKVDAPLPVHKPDRPKVDDDTADD
jgi:hypothetical protein